MGIDVTTATVKSLNDVTLVWDDNGTVIDAVPQSDQEVSPEAQQFMDFIRDRTPADDDAHPEYLSIIQASIDAANAGKSDYELYYDTTDDEDPMTEYELIESQLSSEAFQQWQLADEYKFRNPGSDAYDWPVGYMEAQQVRD